VVQTADDLDRIIHHDVDVIGAYRDFARPAPKRNRRDDGPAACRPWPSTSSAMASTVHKWAHIGHCSETRVPAFLRRYCQWVWQSLFRHCEQSRPRCSWGRAARHVFCCRRRGRSASGSPLLPIGLPPGSGPRSPIHHGYASPRQDHQFARTAVSSHRHSITVNRCHMAPEAARASVGDMDAHAVSRLVIHHRHRAHQVTRIHVLKDRVPCRKFRPR